MNARHVGKEKESAVDRAVRRTASATIWVAVFTVVLAVVSYLQWREIHAGGTDTHNLAEAAVASSRAWVVVSGTGFLVQKDTHFPLGQVVLEDSGSSPAFRVDGWRCVEVRIEEPPMQSGQLQKSARAKCLPITGGTIGHGVPISLNAYVPEVAPTNLVQSTEGPGPHFYYWGVITYDIYPADNRRHTTSFCLKNAGDQFSPCREGGYEEN